MVIKLRPGFFDAFFRGYLQKDKINLFILHQHFVRSGQNADFVFLERKGGRYCERPCMISAWNKVMLPCCNSGMCRQMGKVID